jgi:hypothetical protein
MATYGVIVMKKYWGLVFLVWPLMLFAEDSTLTAVLAKIRRYHAVEFNYQETRRLALVNEPWHGEGRMLSLSDGSLIKCQLRPERILMISTQTRLAYWNAEQGQRYLAETAEVGEAAEQINVLRALIQGQTEGLSSHYDLSAERRGERWVLRVRDRQMPDSMLEISGGEDAHDQDRLRIQIRSADGDISEYLMHKTAEGDPVVQAASELVREALGD